MAKRKVRVGKLQHKSPLQQERRWFMDRIRVISTVHLDEPAIMQLQSWYRSPMKKPEVPFRPPLFVAGYRRGWIVWGSMTGWQDYRVALCLRTCLSVVVPQSERREAGEDETLQLALRFDADGDEIAALARYEGTSINPVPTPPDSFQERIDRVTRAITHLESALRSEAPWPRETADRIRQHLDDLYRRRTELTARGLSQPVVSARRATEEEVNRFLSMLQGAHVSGTAIPPASHEARLAVPLEPAFSGEQLSRTLRSSAIYDLFHQSSLSVAEIRQALYPLREHSVFASLTGLLLGNQPLQQREFTLEGDSYRVTFTARWLLAARERCQAVLRRPLTEVLIPARAILLHTFNLTEDSPLVQAFRGDIAPLSEAELYEIIRNMTPSAPVTGGAGSLTLDALRESLRRASQDSSPVPPPVMNDNAIVTGGIISLGQATETQPVPPEAPAPGVQDGTSSEWGHSRPDGVWFQNHWSADDNNTYVVGVDPAYPVYAAEEASRAEDSASEPATSEGLCDSVQQAVEAANERRSESSLERLERALAQAAQLRDRILDRLADHARIGPEDVITVDEVETLSEGHDEATAEALRRSLSSGERTVVAELGAAGSAAVPAGPVSSLSWRELMQGFPTRNMIAEVSSRLSEESRQRLHGLLSNTEMPMNAPGDDEPDWPVRHASGEYTSIPARWIRPARQVFQHSCRGFFPTAQGTTDDAQQERERLDPAPSQAIRRWHSVATGEPWVEVTGVPAGRNDIHEVLSILNQEGRRRLAERILSTVNLVPDRFFYASPSADQPESTRTVRIPHAWILAARQFLRLEDVASGVV